MTDAMQDGARILIIDDSRDNRLLLRAMLAASGHADVLLAESARDAFHHLGMEESGGPDPQVGLILLDISMPVLDGIEACRLIKAVDRLRDVPIIMVTAMTDPGFLVSAFDAGAVDYITKPVKKMELLARVGSALRLKQSMDTCRIQGLALLKKNKELERAMQEVKVLRGFIPICMSCKKIRDDGGYWQQIESYIQKHSEALFSHGVCPDCYQKLSDQYLKDEEFNSQKGGFDHEH
ncbi:MAG: response regulator [Nitrospirae bacterium]|nr:MAG: response regulator [Nitrospirota bacterium]